MIVLLCYSDLLCCSEDKFQALGKTVIQSVDRAIRILMELQGGYPLALSELAERLELSPSTVHGLVKTLVAQDLVSQDSQTKLYGLGPTVVRLANTYLADFELLQVSPLIRKVVETINFPVRLGVLSGSEIIVIHRELPLRMPFYMKTITKGIPANCSAMGKAILAQELKLLKAFEDPLVHRTARTITSLADFRDHLKSIKQENDGIALEKEELNIGESSVAVPLFGKQNRVIGAVAVVLETSYPKPYKEQDKRPSAADEKKRLKREEEQDKLLIKMKEPISKIADDITDLLGGEPISRQSTQ